MVSEMKRVYDVLKNDTKGPAYFSNLKIYSILVD